MDSRDGSGASVASAAFVMGAKLGFTSDHGDNRRAGTYLELSVPDVDDPVVRSYCSTPNRYGFQRVGSNVGDIVLMRFALSGRAWPRALLPAVLPLG